VSCTVVIIADTKVMVNHPIPRFMGSIGHFRRCNKPSRTPPYAFIWKECRQGNVQQNCDAIR